MFAYILIVYERLYWTRIRIKILLKFQWELYSLEYEQIIEVHYSSVVLRLPIVYDVNGLL